jgi:hypothetical protein
VNRRIIFLQNMSNISFSGCCLSQRYRARLPTDAIRERDAQEEEGQPEEAVCASELDALASVFRSAEPEQEATDGSC